MHEAWAGDAVDFHDPVIHPNLPARRILLLSCHGWFFILNSLEVLHALEQKMCREPVSLAAACRNWITLGGFHHDSRLARQISCP